ncbi:MAG: Phenylalanine-tRNA ligase beta subunit [Candidatus Saccharibacteria bacterium]|nr:Phenylalanine-tRNA ligase beta subunit [Candidatus Saccharibacteria bacterium]
MNVSKNWLQQYLSFELPATVDLVEKIGAQLGAVETVTELSDRYAGAIVVKVVSCQKHENSDHLNVCLIDDGGVVQGVERNEAGLVQVVCGAPNVRADIMAVWLPPGATVPETYDKDPFVLTARELRGVVSNGMLASPRELALGDSHEGILEIHQDFQPGTPFGPAFGMDDAIIEIENKMFTHRPDCFGQLGVAREVAGIMGRPFTSPDWYLQEPVIASGEGLSPKIENVAADVVPRFTAQALKGVVVRPSPVWLQTLLARVGARPINNVVDVTNYLMLLTGQPLHAYDYDKVKALTKGDDAEITVRYPRAGEKVHLLNGKTVEPRPEAIVIASGDTLIGLAGVMGGANTEVDEHTENIILECANFDMYSIRRTSMAHGLFTDAVTRFNKGQSPHQTTRVIAEAIRLLSEVSAATPASQLIDLQAGLSEITGLNIKLDFINSRLGLHLTDMEVITLLKNVEFETYDITNLGEIFVKPPFWRTDIQIAEDVVEEVGRLIGFDRLPQVLPSRHIVPAAKDKLLELKKAIRTSLSRQGANELLTYSFVHGNLIEKAGQNVDQAFQINNALSPDLQYYRLSLVPSLLDKVRPNLKAGYDRAALFELGKAHNVGAIDGEGLPQEFNTIALVYTAADKLKPAGAAYYQARYFAQQMFDDLGYDIEFRSIETLPEIAIIKPFAPGRTSLVYLAGSDIPLGVVGELQAGVRQAFKLPEHTAAFELTIDGLLNISPRSTRYRPLPRFPKVEQDICLKVPADCTYGELSALVEEFMRRQERLDSHVEPLDIYQREDDPKHRQITFRISLASYDRTLTDAEVNRLLEELSVAAKDAFNAERI